MQPRDFTAGDLEGVLALTRAEGWPSYAADPARALRALTAPGIATVVAEEEGTVIGFATAGSDGEIQSYLINIAVADAHRGKGIGKALIAALFARSNAGRMDLLSTEGGEAFYRAFPHRTLPGFRIFDADPRKIHH
jgi:ribosomal protein S18 acetylase RimI-like enzyme